MTLSDPPDDDDFCDHEEADVDILTGRAHCWLCGHRWSVTDDELRRMAKLQAEYDEIEAGADDVYAGDAE